MKAVLMSLRPVRALLDMQGIDAKRSKARGKGREALSQKDMVDRDDIRFCVGLYARACTIKIAADISHLQLQHTSEISCVEAVTVTTCK